MIKWMIKAHPTQNRMARQACVEPRLTLFRRGQRSPAQKCPCDWVLRPRPIDDRPLGRRFLELRTRIGCDARAFTSGGTFYSVAARTAFGVRGRVAETVVPWPGREWTCQLPPAISSC
jgi:hypothetical protein